MTRACQHHERYTAEGRIDCSRFGTVPLQTCSGCMSFVLQIAERRLPLAVSLPERLCRHRGSKRTCCGELYLCKKFPGESCTPGLSGTPELHSCQTCDLFEPLPEAKS
jgi:hypothetical protein